MRTVAVLRSTWSAFGGAEAFTLGVIRELLRREQRVILLTRAGQGWPLAHSLLEVVEVRVPASGRLRRLEAFAAAAGAFVSSRSFDAVFAVDRVPLFTHLHGGGGAHRTSLALKAGGAPGLAIRSRLPFHRRVLELERRGYLDNPLFQAVHCCSRMVRDDLARAYGLPEDRLRVIPNGFDWRGQEEAFGRREALRRELLARHGLPAGRRYLLFLGSGFARKGLLELAAALADLPRDVEVLVVGRGSPWPARLRAALHGAASRLHFLGPQPVGWRYASLACGLAMPARYEPFGLAVAEAQGMGLPVLVGPRTGYADVLEATGEGVVAPPGRLVDGLRRLLDLAAGDGPAQRERIRGSVRHLDERQVAGRLVDEFLFEGERA